jgi:hypothetical protein
MNDDITTAVKVLAVLGATGAVIWIGVVMIKAAKRGGGGMRGLGAAALMMFSWASMRDPGSNPVAEAQDGRVRKGTNSGEPLDRDPPAA